MKEPRKPNTSRKPPEPSDSHADTAAWISRVMPDLHPVVAYLDRQIRETFPALQFAIKWKKAYYGLPDRGWIIELVAYDVSVNVVFLGGADFKAPPPLGESDRTRYVKVRSLDEAAAPEIQQWIAESGTVPGWQ